LAHLLQITKVELGLRDILAEDFSLMGVLDYFSKNSAVGQDVSTHYVHLHRYAGFQSKPKITLDDQYGEFEWFNLSVLADDEKFNPYIHNYASWLLNNLDNI
jgi:hypothetical protein